MDGITPQFVLYILSGVPLPGLAIAAIVIAAFVLLGGKGTGDD